MLKSANKYKYWLLTTLLFVAAISLERYYSGKANDITYWSKSVTYYLGNSEKELNSALNQIAVTVESNGVVPDCSDKINERKDYLVLIYKNQQLSFWSDNMPAIDNRQVLEAANHQLLKFRNGWYEVVLPDSASIIRYNDTFKIVGLLLVKTEFAFQNLYLDNKFNPELHLPDNAELQVTGLKNNAAVLSGKGDYLFSLNFSKTPGSGNYNIISLILYCLATFMLLLLLHANAKKLLKNSITDAWILVAVIFGLRWLMLYYKFPDAVYSTSLFDPAIYYSSFFNASLGDLLINVLLIFYVVISVYPYLKQLYGQVEIVRQKKLSGLFVVLLLCMVYTAGIYIHHLLSGLISHSHIVFNFSNIFDLNGYSFIGFIIFCILFFAFHFFIDGVIRLVKRLNLLFTEKITLLMLSVCIFLFIMLLLKQAGLMTDGFSAFAMSVSMVVLVQYYHEGKDYNFSLTKGVAAIIIFAAYGAGTIYKYDAAREKLSRQHLAAQLESNRDETAEHLFDDISDKIMSDKVLITTLEAQESPQPLIDKRLKQLYFKGYWQKYDIAVTCFDSTGHNLLKGDKNNLSHIARMINEQGEVLHNPLLHFIHTSSGRTDYLASIPMIDVHKKHLYGTIVINIESKFMQENRGFPELVLSNNTFSVNELSGYSYARYKDGQMVSRFGPFPYNYSLVNFDEIKSGSEFRDFESYSHLLLRTQDDSLIVISKPLQGLVDYITLFFYIFSLIFLFVFALMMVGKVPASYFTRQVSFKIKIQLSILAIVILSLFIVGGGTVYYIVAKYNAQQYDLITQRISSALLDIENKLDGKERLVMDDETNVAMSELSNSINSDFNIYNTQGDLVFSSQSKITDKGITSSKMPWQVLNQFSFYKKSQIVHAENIGKLRYIAAYMPIRNIRGNVVGYLNLPYFSKQTELRKEISSFLVTLINVYALLFVLAVAAAYFLSVRITRPLKLIQDSLANISLNKKNKLVEWENNDEIGALIAEYNRMVNELANSAEILAKSERETAWREMAKQVAHEIKNPLTPMKMSIQHLQKAMREESPDIDKLFNRISHTLIAQIDDLSSIATAFSNFAQMPNANNELVNLEQVLRNTINLYKQADNIKIEYSQAIVASQQQSPLYVFADKEQLFRVFSNLTKNAIQAIEANKQGLIKIEILPDSDSYIIAISDNGIGIPDEERHKIFMPNFTTKTTGTGLGLAMIKNILEGMGSKIWFESHVGIGTTFFVKIARYKG